MHLLLWIFVGYVVGWLAGMSPERKRYGPSMGGTMRLRPCLARLPSGSARYRADVRKRLAGLVNGRRLYAKQLVSIMDLET